MLSFFLLRICAIDDNARLAICSCSLGAAFSYEGISMAMLFVNKEFLTVQVMLIITTKETLSVSMFG